MKQGQNKGLNIKEEWLCRNKNPASDYFYKLSISKMQHTGFAEIKLFLNLAFAPKQDRDIILNLHTVSFVASKRTQITSAPNLFY